MNSKTFIALILVAVLAGAGGWFAARHSTAPIAPPEADGRKPLYYQSAMHPWIKSDKPGKCTICGMDLVPIYAGDKGFAMVEGTVTLNSNSITVLNVQTDIVKRRPLQRTLRVAGTIEDDDTRHRRLSAYVEGRIDKLFVNHIGAEVTAGQPLATFYSPALLNAEREYAVLLQRKSSTTSPILSGENDHLLEAAAVRLRRLGLTAPQIAALADKPGSESDSEIIAPMSGTVITRDVYEGQYVKEGDRLFELADFSTMWFQFDLYERDLAWVKVGQRVDVTTPSVPGKTWSVPVTFIDPNISDPTRSAKVRVEIPNPLIESAGTKRRELFHRLYAEGIVNLEIPEVLAVPRLAVLSTGERTVAYIDKGGGAYEQRRLKLGRHGDEFWEVLSGLSEGDRVVTTGNLLIDGQAQLDQSASGNPGLSQNPSPPTATNSPASSALSETQRVAVKSFIELADSLTRALSSDDLKAFNDRAAQVHAALPSLVTQFDHQPDWQPLVQKLEMSGHLEKAADLKSARKSFHPFSAALVEFSQQLRRQPGEFATLKIYRCPMVKQAFPGAPNGGVWLQLSAPIHNPYFGAEMLDCGNEVAQ